MKKNHDIPDVLKFLCLEDSPQDAEIMSEKLIEGGYNFKMDITASKEEFISLLHTHIHAIILSDFKLPGFDGFEALQLSKQICPNVPFICVSGTVGEETAVELLKKGAVDYVLKDRLGRLPSAVKHALDEARERKIRIGTEELLRENEGKFRNLINNANEAIIVAQDGKLKFVNCMMMELTGYSEPELLTIPFASLIYQDDREMVVANYKKRIDNNLAPTRYTFRLLTKDGIPIWVEIGAVMIEWNGKPATLNFLSDISERKKAEDAKNASEVRYRRLFESAKDGILILDARTGVIVDVNPYLSNLLGYPNTHFLGIKVWELGPFKDIFANQDKFFELQQKEYVRYDDLPLETADGRKIDVEFVSNVYLVNQQKVIQCNIRNITERKLAEQYLHIQSAALEAAANSIVITDNKGTIQWANHAFTTLTGYSEEEAVGRNPRELIKSGQHSQDFYKELWKTVLEGKVWKGELINRRKDGCYYNEEMTITPLMDKHNRISHFIAVKQDISGRKRAEEEINNLNTELEHRIAQRTAQLEEANKDLEAFSYSVSHDLRAPLRSIIGYTNIFLEDYHQKVDDEGKRVLNIVIQATSHMSQLIDDLLEFSRLGRKELSMTNIDMNIKVAIILEELISQEKAQNIKLKVLPLDPCQGDPIMLQQVWINLINNALKYSRKKEITNIEIGSYKENQEICYYIRDNGCGFDMKYIDKLFGVFQRLHKMNEFEGTGVGLALVKRIVHRHDGRVWAEGKIDEGATFYFSIPGRK